MKAITQFLNTNVGFHYEDLSLMRRVELKEIKKELNVSNEWILLALSKDKLENWEEWGFGLFKKNDKNSVKLVFTGPQANSHCQYLIMIK